MSIIEGVTGNLQDLARTETGLQAMIDQRQKTLGTMEAELALLHKVKALVAEQQRALAIKLGELRAEEMRLKGIGSAA